MAIHNELGYMTRQNINRKMEIDDATKKKQIRYDSLSPENLQQEDLSSLHVMNSKLLSAIYNDTQLKRDEQINFMKIITQLSDVVRELKDQNNIRNSVTKSNGSAKDREHHHIGKPLSPRINTHKILAERDYDSPTVPLELKDVQYLASSWDQVSKTSRNLPASSTDSNNSSVTNSAHSSISFYYKNSDHSEKLCKENNKRIPKKLQNKILRERLRRISIKLRKQGKYWAKTRIVIKEFQEQGKSLVSMIEGIKRDQENEKKIIDSLMNRNDKNSKSDEWNHLESVAMKEMEDRITRLELKLVENSSHLVSKDKEVCKLMEELKHVNLIKDDYQNKTIQLNTEISEFSTKLAANKKQIEELKEAVRNEKALNDSMKHAYEINLRNVVGNAVQEQRHIVEEIKMSFDNNIAALQTENAELKARISQLGEDGKKICNESKIRVVKAKKQLYSQASLASQKLLKADSKIKEFYYTIEKLVKGIYYRLYEAELDKIKRKCHEEGGVQAASCILGVSAIQMSRVLAAGAVPSLNDWIECCKRLVYKEKFSEDLAGYILSLFWPILPKDIAKDERNITFSCALPMEQYLLCELRRKARNFMLAFSWSFDYLDF